jgi:hypothetical protein
MVTDPAGAHVHATLLETTGYPSRDRASAQVLELMRFAPAVAGGCRAAAAAIIPITWQSNVPRQQGRRPARGTLIRQPGARNG